MNQTMNDSLDRIKKAIDGKDRHDYHQRANNGARVHVVSHAEAEPTDILALCDALPPEVLKKDSRLQAIQSGSLNAGTDFVALKVTDLDYLVAAVEKAMAPKPAA